MPYIPRRSPNMVGPPAELLSAAKHQPAMTGPEPAQAQPKRGRSQTLALPTYDMQNWDVPVEKIYKHLFGTEPDCNEYTRELVLPRRTDGPASGG